MPIRHDRARHGLCGLMAVSLIGAAPALGQPAPAIPAVPAKDSTAAATPAVQPIDLPTALRLAGANNIDLALVKEALTQAQAQNEAATLSLLPTLSGGFGYSKHNGAVQDVSGNVIEAYKQLHSITGGINSQINYGDAIFNKLAAMRLQSAAEYSVDAGHNATILAAAGAYIDLVNARANEKIAEDAAKISGDYEDQITRAVGIGLANKSDALRVSVQTQNYRIALRQAKEASVAASAKLATVLHLSPTIQFVPADDAVPQITLVPLETSLNALVTEAFAKRPELKASGENIGAANWLKTQSIYGPLIPSVGAQALYGDVSGGRVGVPSNSGGTQDYALMLNWKLGSGGLLDFGRMDYAQSKLDQTKLNDAKLHDEIGRQVVQSFEGVHSAFDQLELHKKNVDLAQQSLQLSQGRKEFGVAAVLEVIEAQKDLVQARAAYLRAMTAYTLGQYALAEAVGRIGE